MFLPHTPKEFWRRRICLLPWLWWWLCRYSGPNTSNCEIKYVQYFIYQLYPPERCFLKEIWWKIKGIFLKKKMQPVGKAVWHPKGHIRGKPWQSHCPPLVAAAVSSLILLTAGWQYCCGPVARAQDVGEERDVPSFPSRALRVMRSKGWASAFLGLRSHTHVSVDCPACSWWRSRRMSLHKNHLLWWASLMGSGFPPPIPPQSPLPRDAGKYYWEKKIKKWWAQDICFSGFLSFFSSHF